MTSLDHKAILRDLKLKNNLLNSRIIAVNQKLKKTLSHEDFQHAINHRTQLLGQKLELDQALITANHEADICYATERLRERKEDHMIQLGAALITSGLTEDSITLFSQTDLAYRDLINLAT